MYCSRRVRAFCILQEKQMKKAFTLIEILIVVSILGILGAIVFPEFQAHAQQSREAAAKDNLRIFRNAIAIYTAEHNGIPPGYVNGNLFPGTVGGLMPMTPQLTGTTDIIGDISKDRYGPYLSEIPENPLPKDLPQLPFNSILILNEGDSFPEPDGAYDWIFHPVTKEIRLDCPGTDSEGVNYYDY